MVTVQTKNFLGHIIFSDARGRWPPPTGKIVWKSDSQFLGIRGRIFEIQPHLEIFLGGNGGKGWKSPVTHPGAKYCRNRKTLPGHHPEVFGVFEKCPNFGPNLGGGGSPDNREIRLPNNGDISPTERNYNGNTVTPRLLCIYPQFLPCSFWSKKIFTK